MPRRLGIEICWPGRSAAKPPGSRRMARGCSTSTEATSRPDTCRSRPRRTVSTSGSSGTAVGQSLAGESEEPLAEPDASVIAIQAASAACCSAAFLERPSPVPICLPPTRTTAWKNFW